MASSKEILHKHKKIYDYLDQCEGLKNEDVISSMEEFAKQECLEFMRWGLNNERVLSDVGAVNTIFELWQQSKPK